MSNGNELFFNYKYMFLIDSHFKWKVHEPILSKIMKLLKRLQQLEELIPVIKKGGVLLRHVFG